MKDITTSNSHAYIYRLDDTATAENGKKRIQIDGKKLRGGVRMGNFEIREGFEAPETDQIVRDLVAEADRIAPWAEFVGAPEIVGFSKGEEIYVEGATVASNIRENVGNLTYKARVVSILYSTATARREAFEAVYRACWQAIETEAPFGWGANAKDWAASIDASLMQDADSELRGIATDPKDGRRKAFALWAYKRKMFAAEGDDFLDEEDSPFYAREFQRAYDGITGADLFAKHNPYALNLKMVAELAGEAA